MGKNERRKLEREGEGVAEGCVALSAPFIRGAAQQPSSSSSSPRWKWERVGDDIERARETRFNAVTESEGRREGEKLGLVIRKLRSERGGGEGKVESLMEMRRRLHSIARGERERERERETRCSTYPSLCQMIRRLFPCSLSLSPSLSLSAVFILPPSLSLYPSEAFLLGDSLSLSLRVEHLNYVVCPRIDPGNLCAAGRLRLFSTLSLFLSLSLSYSGPAPLVSGYYRWCDRVQISRAGLRESEPIADYISEICAILACGCVSIDLERVQPRGPMSNCDWFNLPR